jgi:leucyl aminopeptidase
MFTSITVAQRLSPESLVFAHFQDEGLDARSKSLAAGLGVLDVIEGALKRTEATGEPGVVVEAFPAKSAGKSGAKRSTASARILIVGLGKKDKFECSGFRVAAAAVARKFSAVKSPSASFEFEGIIKEKRLDASDAGQCCGEAIGLLGWVCDEFKGKATTDPKRVKLQLGSGDNAFREGLARGLAIAGSANFCRTLSQTPPNIATTTFMAQQAQSLARKVGLSCRVFKGSELEREKLVGLINVGKASIYKPCMVRLEYNPKGVSKSAKPIVLVGKTMTYDTGGLSLKVNNGMVGMKRDKDGGCAVLGAMHAIATVIKPRRRVVALLSIAENSVSEEAYRPDDVIRYRNGVTVEVTNTDAEGRLVLADALCWACEKENPSYIVDLATLTGGVVVALGSTFAGMFCDDDKLRAKVEAASTSSGERVWRLPMHAEYKEMMKSPVADIVNSNPNRKASPIQGAAFLAHFVEEKIPWCHLDIAGVHVADKNAGMFVDGPTGWGVRLLAELLDAE